MICNQDLLSGFVDLRSDELSMKIEADFFEIKKSTEVKDASANGIQIWQYGVRIRAFESSPIRSDSFGALENHEILILST